MKEILVDLERQIMADQAITHWNGKEVGPNPGGVAQCQSELWNTGRKRIGLSHNLKCIKESGK